MKQARSSPSRRWARCNRASVWARLAPLCARVEARGGGAYRTDNGNLVADLHGWDAGDPARIAALLQAIPGVVGHGLFLTEVDAAVIAADGIVTTLERRSPNG